MNMKWLQNLKPLQRNLLVGGVVLMMAVLVANMVYLPKKEKIEQLTTDLAQLNSEVTIYSAKVKHLDRLLAENARLKAQLEEQRQQLPEQHEVADLLKQVTDLGAQSGLIFRLWRPGAAVPSSTGLYQELPVQVEVTGSYHQVGIFFEQVAGLNRIVNISDVKVARDTKGGDGLLTIFTATAFAAPPKPVEEADAAEGSS
jgi:type IV pilus assembly protein PilO